MLKDYKTFLENITKRHYVRVVAFVVFGVILGAFFTSTFLFSDTVLVDNVTEFPIEEQQIGENAYVLDGSRPVAIAIPTAGIDAEFEGSLGLDTEGAHEVPEAYDTVGWYKYSPTPGELGPSVILGHVDSHEGPAVFFSIGQLEKGDLIEITRADGSVATFNVTGIGRYEQSKFPQDLVYGDIDHAGLRLITCSGTFNKGEQSYSHNTVVYAALNE